MAVLEITPEQEPLDIFYSWLKESDNIVFFGGAGVSTESGIPDFRSVDGLYNQKYKYPPETMISRSFFNSNPKDFFEFYRDKLIHSAKPNSTHKALAKLEKDKKLKAVVTQNIDGLHQDAGSENVLELHGSIKRNFCMNCNKKHGLESVKQSTEIPTCSCNGTIKPDVVLYEERLDDTIIEKAVEAIENADMLIVGGTSLIVYPAAGLINYYRGKKLVLINKDETSFDSKADLVLHESLGKVFSPLLN